MLRLDDVSHRFDSGFQIDLNFEVEAGITVLFGRSGSGKTSTLGLIAGLSDPDFGRIELGRQVLFDRDAAVSVPPYRRQIGYIFQQPSLFPHLTVEANIRYGAHADVQISELVERFRIEGLVHRYPDEISGGEQQRVSLARSLATRPLAMLMDEPFSALDAGVRFKFQSDLLRVKEQSDIPILVVTHSLSEAFALADQLIVIDEGQVVESYDAPELFRRPMKRVTAELLGVENLLRCIVKSVSDHEMVVNTGGIDLVLDPAARFNIGDQVWLGVRAVDVRLVVTDSPRENELSARIERVIPSVASNTIYLRATSGDDGFQLVMDLDEHHRTQHMIRPDETVRVALKRNRAFLCD